MSLGNTAILLFLFVVIISLVSVLNLLHFYISTFRNIIIIIIISIIIIFMQGIYTHIPETNYVPREYSCSVVSIHGDYIVSFSIESIVLLH